MLRWAVLFLIVSLIAGAVGFSAVAGVAAVIAKAFFGLFLVLFLVTLIAGIALGSRLTRFFEGPDRERERTHVHSRHILHR